MFPWDGRYLINLPAPKAYFAGTAYWYWTGPGVGDIAFNFNNVSFSTSGFSVRLDPATLTPMVAGKFTKLKINVIQNDSSAGFKAFISINEQDTALMITVPPYQLGPFSVTANVPTIDTDNADVRIRLMVINAGVTISWLAEFQAS